MPSFWETLTLESSKDAQVAEFVKKYKNCFVFLQKDSTSEKVLLYFDKYSEKDRRFHFSTLKSELVYKIKYDTTAIISASFPEQTLFTYDKTLYFFTRVPARQYSKAPNSDNCVFYNINKRLTYKRLVPELAEISLFEKAYTPTFVRLETAIPLLQEDKEASGFALSTEFGITLSPYSDEVFLLWYQTIPIGEIRDKIIEIKVPVFKQEVLDFTNRNSYRYMVK